MPLQIVGGYGSAVDTDGNANASVSHVLSPARNRVVLAFIAAWRSVTPAITVSGATFGGVAMSVAVEREVNNGVGEYFYEGIWFIKEADLPAAGSNILTVTFAAAVAEVAIVAVTISGVDQANPWRGSGASGGVATYDQTSASLDSDVTTGKEDWWVVGLNGNWANAVTGGSGDVQIGSAIAAGNLTDVFAAYEKGTDATATVGWTFASQSYVICGRVLVAGAPEYRSLFPEPATRSRRGRGLKSWLTPQSWWREALA